MTSPRTWSTAGWHDRRESRTRGADDEIDAGIADYEEETMHDSGEHDTLDDQLAYEAEHGTREYQWARDLYDLLLRGDTFTTAGLWRAEQIAQDLMQSLAPRPPITPTGSIDDVPFTEADQ